MSTTNARQGGAGICISLEMMRDGFGTPIRCMGRLIGEDGSILAVSERSLSDLVHHLSRQIDGPDVSVCVALTIQESHRSIVRRSSLITQLEGWGFDRSRKIASDLVTSAI
jgi:hypothetical protein